MSGLWRSIPAAQLGEDLLHVPEDLAKHWRLLHPHPIGANAEAKPQGAVKRVLLFPAELITGESILLIVVFIFIMSHCIEEGVPDTLQQAKQMRFTLNAVVLWAR